MTVYILSSLLTYVKQYISQKATWRIKCGLTYLPTYLAKCYPPKKLDGSRSLLP